MKISQLCSQCGICCKLFLINLTQKEWESGGDDTHLKKSSNNDDFTKIQKFGGNILKQQKDGSCIYLKNNLCSIHQNRPQSCRDFFCKSKETKFKKMIDIIGKARKTGTG